MKFTRLGFSFPTAPEAFKALTSFFNNGLIDDFKLFVSDRNLGKNGDGSIKIYFGTFLKNKKKIVEKVNLLGEKLISYKIK